MQQPDPSPVEYLADPLSTITRVERRNLLLTATAGVLVSKAGLVPTQLSALGVTLSGPSQNVFIVVVAMSVTYFLGAFLIYGLADFLIWRKKYQDYLEQVHDYEESWGQEDQRAYDMRRESLPDIAWLYRRSKPAAIARLLFEYLTPVAFGLYSICSLVFAASGR